ncbi:MAG: ribonuclease P protein component [Nitratireductor sp.]
MADIEQIALNAPLMPTLKTRKEFLAIRSGKRHVTANFNMQAKPRDAETGIRIGYTVTKKIGNAVVRSRIKRRFKHAFAYSVALKLKKTENVNMDFILVAKKPVLNVPFSTLVAELTKGIDRLVITGNKAA